MMNVKRTLPSITSKRQIIRLKSDRVQRRITMTSFSHMIPIDRNGFFCTGRKSLEASTADNVFTLETPQRQTYTRHHITNTNSNTTANTNNKSEDINSSVIVTPEKTTEDSTHDKIQNTNAEVKIWAHGMLRAEPCSFVTQAGLLLALKHKAPAPVIQFMLKINPNVMNFPKMGPTPLQVAVQHNAALDVVQLLLNASPVGECIRNIDFPESPLEYAKRCRSNRPDLIELLSRKSKIRDQSRKKQPKGKAGLPSDLNLLSRYSSLPLEQTNKHKVPLLSPPPSFSTRHARASSIISSSTASEPPPTSQKIVLSEVKISSNKDNSQQSRYISISPVTSNEKTKKVNNNKIDREELNNVKTLCALLWKSQRKMTKQMNSCKNEIESQSELLSTMGTKDEILEDLMKQQRSQMFRNWIALDTKERLYQSRLEKMEKHYVQELEKRLHSWTGSMRLWNESTREQLQELQTFVDLEAETNEYFRNNMTDWIEKCTQDQENNTAFPSEIFSTNLGEINQNVPLCSAFRRGFCGYGTDTTDGDTDPVIGVDQNTTPLNPIKKRSWRPLFKNRDYSNVG